MATVSNGSNIYSANREWSCRPDDERFTSLDDLQAACDADRAASVEKTVAVRDVRAVVLGDGSVGLKGQTSAAKLNHYSFGQVASAAGAPGGYLRSLTPDLAVSCINHGFDRLSEAGRRENHKLLLRRPADAGGLGTVRALTSTSYARVWDSQVCTAARRLQDAGFNLPLDWSGKPAGAYRGDRDAFVFLTNGGSIVEDPTLRAAWSGGSGPGGLASLPTMFRGVILRNSEVGAACLSIETFLFRVVCGNHIIWSAENHRQFKRRHVGTAGRDWSHTLAHVIRGELTRTASADESRIEALAAHVLGKDRDKVIEVGRGLGLSRDLAESAYDRAERDESCSPRSAWGYANGITRVSQDAAFQDDRYSLDLAAGRLLARIPVYA